MRKGVKSILDCIILNVYNPVMARPLRIEYPGAWYHAMNRGAGYRKIFSDKEDCQLFIAVLKEACDLYHVFISSYCLMPNHYHLLVFTPEGNLSRFMRHLNGVYTQRHNRLYKKDGPLFRGRYKAVLVQEEHYLTGVVRYIHRNPLKARMVKRVEDYKWSSHKDYLKGKSGEKWLNIDPILMSFARKRSQAVAMWKEFVEQDLDDEVTKFYSKKNQRSILGEESFIKEIKERFIYSDHQLNIEIKEKKGIQGEGRIEKINHEVCKYFKISMDELFSSSRGEENIQRHIAVSLSRELSGLSFSLIANRYKISSYRTVGSLCYRFREKLKKNKRLSKQYEKVKTLCSQEWT